MRILVNPVQHLMSDVQVQYLGHDVIGNVEKLEELKENVIYLMENLNFIPDEHSFVAPYIEVEDENKDEEDDKDGDDESSQKNAAAGKGTTAAAPKDPKKMTAAEKKKAEEEAKKKAEEDSKAAAAMAESAESQIERARQEEIAR